MKFVHMADFHFDAPFIKLSDKDTLGDLKRLEQRTVFKKIVEYIKQNEIPFLFISGDLYEHEYIKKSTIEYINNLFKEIPNTKIFISPGNHDPFIKNSYYNKFNWNSNVKIFTSKIERIELDGIDIYGFGFDDFYCTSCGIEEIEIQNKDKINILVIHGTLDGANIEEKQYNSLNKKILEEKGFNYVALGHIHKTNYEKGSNSKIIYPGSSVALGFDEIGQHGFIVGDINFDNLQLDYIPICESEFVEIEIDVTQLNSMEDIIEKINQLDIKENQFVKIILNGKRNFEINIDEIFKFVLNNKIIKIKNKTKINYDLEKMSNENTLKGMFAKAMLEKLQENNLSKEDIEILEKAVEIGIDALS